jgi:Cu-Zn family superoxide dismutase
MNLKKVLAGGLGLGVVGALSVSAAVIAHQGSRTTGRETREVLAAGAATSAAGGVDDVAAQPEMRPELTSGQDGHGHVRVVLRDVNGKRTAQVDIYPLAHGGNRVDVLAWNLAPGFHGIHIHATGVCDPAGAKPFASAGGHFNPTGSAEGMQAGAFPVLLAGANGRAAAEFLDSNFTVADLFGPTGAAVVIHALADNYANIPDRYTAGGVAGPDMETQMTGDGGARVACGVVAKPRGSTAAGEHS